MATSAGLYIVSAEALPAQLLLSRRRKARPESGIQLGQHILDGVVLRGFGIKVFRG